MPARNGKWELKNKDKHCWGLYSICIAVVVLAFGSGVRAEEAAQPEISPPKLLKFVHATYPSKAKEKGLEGAVDLTVVVTVEGMAEEIQVLTSVGHGFDEAAIAAVSQFTFEPAMMDGNPIPVRIGYTYRFKLEKKEVKIEPGQVVSGTIKERGVGLPIVGAEVTIEGKARTSTNNKGEFALKRIAPGTYKVFVNHSEYQQMETDLVVEEGKQLELALRLEPLIDNPYEVVVKGKKQEAVVTRYVLEQRTLETVPGTFGDPLRVVETLPGVARSMFNSGMLIIRGAMPGDSNVFVDGVYVPLLYHFMSGPSVINPNFLDSIDYYPGNFPTRYGGAIAGAVDITPKREAVENWGGELDINLLNAGAFLEGPITDKGGFRLAARRSYVDLVIAAAMKIAGEDGVLVAPFYWDFQGQAYYNIDPDNRVELFWMGSHDSLKLVTQNKEEEGADINLNTAQNFQRVFLTWRNVGEKYSFKFSPYWGIDTVTMDTAGIDMDIALHWIGGRAELNWDPFKWLTIRPGLEGTIAIGDFTGKIPLPMDYYIPGSEISGLGEEQSVETTRMSIGDKYYGAAAYLDFDFRPVESLSLVPGIRGELFHHSGGNIWMWDPRFVARWTVGGGVTLKGGVGRFSMAPDPMYTDERYGNPDLKYQWAMHYSGGVEWAFKDYFSIDVIGYYVHRYDLAIGSDELVESDDGLKPLMASNDGWGRSYGMEAMIRLSPTERFYGWIAYTLSRSELAGFMAEVDTGDGQGGSETSNKLTLSPFDQTHILSLVGSIKVGRGWETGLRMRFVSGNPTTPFSGGHFVGDSMQFMPVSGGIYSQRLDPFFQLDARVEKKWTFEYWKMSLYLDVQNITNNANSEFEIYDYRFRKKWKVPGIPFFPSLGATGEF